MIILMTCPTMEQWKYNNCMITLTWCLASYARNKVLLYVGRSTSFPVTYKLNNSFETTKSLCKRTGLKKQNEWQTPFIQKVQPLSHQKSETTSSCIKIRHQLDLLPQKKPRRKQKCPKPNCLLGHLMMMEWIQIEKGKGWREG